MIGPEGRLRRDELARLVFTDPAARLNLERITHPRIRDLWMRQVEAWQSRGRPLAVVVIPLLFETGAENDFQSVVCVACSPDVQRKRLTERGWSEKQIQERQSAQWPVSRKIARADYVVWTDSGIEIMDGQMERVFQRISRA